MTRKEEVWQRALTEAKENPDDFVRGAEFAHSIMITKAYEWMRKELCDYFDASREDFETFIEDFKKFMEK